MAVSRRRLPSGVTLGEQPVPSLEEPDMRAHRLAEEVVHRFSKGIALGSISLYNITREVLIEEFAGAELRDELDRPTSNRRPKKCSSCGMGSKACSNSIFNGDGSACCATCRDTDTHDMSGLIWWHDSDGKLVVK